MRILGIDPGSVATGFGIIEVADGCIRYITSGCVRARGENFPARLKEIFDGVRQLTAEHQPDEMAIEKVFVRHNIDSALKLGQARGAAICAALLRDLAVAEYTPAEVKLAIVGKGCAAKAQVQHMVRAMLSLPGTPQADAADALAIALCHAHTRSTLQRMNASQSASLRPRRP